MKLADSSALYVGDSTVSAVYLGDELVWSGSYNPLTAQSWTHAYWAENPAWSNPGDGNRVSSWTDAGSAALDLAKKDANGPVYRAAVGSLGSQPALQFAQAEYMRTTGGSNWSAPFTLAFIGCQTDGARTGVFMDSGTTVARGYLASSAATKCWEMYNETGGYDTAGYTRDGSPHLFVAVFDTTPKLYVDNIEVALTGSYNLSYLAYGMTVGARKDGHVGGLLTGYAAFAGRVPGVMAEADRNSLWAWASDHYKLKVPLSQYYVDWPAWGAADAVSGFTFTRIADSSALGGGRLAAASSGEPGLNNYVDYLVDVDAGTYTLTVNYLKYSWFGIFTVTLDGTSLGTIDMYSAGTAYNTIAEFTGIALSAGVHTVRMQATSKNASSTSYGQGAQWLSLTRTGA